MLDTLTFHASDKVPVVVLFSGSATYIAYHFGLMPSRLAKLAPSLAEGGRAIMAARVLGGLLLGLAPALVWTLGLGGSLAEMGIAWPKPVPALLWALGPAAVILPFILVASRRPEFTEEYPPIRGVEWTGGRIALSIATWLAYLVGYETLFRGFLLLPLAAWCGPWPAIAIMTGLYAFAHIAKNQGETVGSLFMGVLWAAMTLETGSILSAIVLHGLIANSADVFAIRSARRAATSA